MKKTLIATLSIISLSAFAQQPIAVTVNKESSTDIANNSYSVDIPQATLKEIKNNWQKYTGKSSKGKALFVNGEFVQQNMENTNISPNSFTLYSNLTETTEGVHLTARLPQNGIEVGNRNQPLAVEKYLRDFAVVEYRKAVEKELKAEENKLASLEQDLAKIIKGEEKSTKTINVNERSNEQAVDAIATNNSDIAVSGEKITEQKKMVEYTAADPNATKGAKKTLDELKGEKKDLQKANETQQKKTDNRNKENRAEDRNLTKSQMNYETITLAIAQQTVVVNAVKAKLEKII